MDVTSWLRSLGFGLHGHVSRQRRQQTREDNHEELHVDGGIARCRIAGNR